ncbi:MAG: D-alanyl-D-alanine carboxypeptidase family protein [Aurantimonas endophytica]|uniref:D-alanyl-D-alanine carboxypeptidase n=1 Tax=Aurantimonas endophytica TaxID=1522175 RepID=A0A7W6MRX4_9HYPH|nr:D-alanyl-D-alanine carboxypeptidase [Aurantimonas endophytica]
MKTRPSRRLRLLTGICVAASLLVAAPASAQPTPAQPAADADAPREAGMASIVVDVASGKVLSQEHATERRYPASTTKLMTAYLALKAVESGEFGLDSPVIMTREAAAEAPSKMGFEPGSVMRLDVALRMMLVKSANDVAHAIGQVLANGSQEDFVAMMNAEALRLGMKDTRFINANGLPGDGQYSSAKDLAMLGLAIRRDFPAFTDYFGTEAIAAGNAIMKNGNKLLGRFDGAEGMKTGYICASGFNLVSSATRDGRTLVAVVIGANGTIPRERRSAEILEAGFKADLAAIDTTLDELPVSAGEPVDISDYICSAKGRTDRANERQADADRDEVYGSPYLHELNRPEIVVPVSLGGAAGNDIVEAGVSVIDAYGIPIPTWRPDPPTAVLALTPEDVGVSQGTGVLTEGEDPVETSAAVRANVLGSLSDSADEGSENPARSGDLAGTDGKTPRIGSSFDDAPLRPGADVPIPGERAAN